jgi:hypothetical protein
MTASETLRTAAALMREQHGPTCPDHRLWSTVADVLDQDATQAGGSERVEIDAVKAARRFLVAQEVRT